MISVRVILTTIFCTTTCVSVSVGQNEKLVQALAESATVADYRTKNILRDLSQRALDQGVADPDAQRLLQLRVWDANMKVSNDATRADLPQSYLRRALDLARDSPKEAHKCAQMAWDGGVRTVQSKWALAITAFTTGDLDSAIRICDEGIEEYGKYSRFYQVRVQSLYQQFRFKEAELCALEGLSSFRTGHRDDEDHAMFLHFLSAIRYEEGRFDSALDSLRRLRDFEERWPPGGMEWSCCTQLGELRIAEAMSARRDPGKAILRFNLMAAWNEGYVSMRKDLDRAMIDQNTKLVMDYAVALSDPPWDVWMRRTMREQRPRNDDERLLFAIGLTCVPDPTAEDLRKGRFYCQAVKNSPDVFPKIKAQTILVANYINAGEVAEARVALRELKQMTENSSGVYHGQDVLTEAAKKGKRVFLGQKRQDRMWLIALPGPSASRLFKNAQLVD